MRHLILAALACLSVAAAAAEGGVVAIESAKQFDELVAATKGTVIVDFYADWCGPCKVVSPLLDEVVKNNPGKVTVLKVNVDTNEDLAKRFEVSGIPNLLKYQDGKKVDSMVGALPKEQLDAWVLGAAKQ